MTSSSPHPFPAVLAALAGFALAAGAIRLEEKLRRGKPEPRDAPPGTVRASDEPRALQLKRAAEPDRGRRADMPAQDSLARLEGRLLAHDRADFGRPAAAHCRRSGVLRTARDRAGDHRTGVDVRHLHAGEHDQCAVELSRRRHAGRRLPADQRPDRAHRRQQRRQADPRIRPRSRHRVVERECRREGDLRCAQYRLRRGREARLLQAQRLVAVIHVRRRRGADPDSQCRRRAAIGAGLCRISPRSSRPAGCRCCAGR